MNGKRLLAMLLILAALLSTMAGAAVAVPLREEGSVRGVSLTTDAAFFAKLNMSLPGLSAVKSAVSAKNYSLAKTELLKFCKTYFAQYDPPFNTKASAHWYEAAMEDTYTFQEYYRANAIITATASTKYQINIGGDVSGLYILSSYDKTTDEIAVASRSVSGKAPQLIVSCADGSTVTLTATADAMVRAGSYSAKNYGTDATLYVKDHYTKNADGTYTPYGNDTKRVYLRFDTSKIPSNAKKATLVLYAHRVSGSASGAFTESSLRLNVMSSYCKTWTESNLTWDYLKSLNSLSHFSWKGIPGGFDWQKPAYTPSEWLNYNDRFCQHAALVQKAKTYATGSANYLAYMNKAKEQILDFINDAGAATPLNRDIEAANRAMEFVYIYKNFLDGSVLTADENVKLLSWVYDEGTYLNSGTKVNSNEYLFNDANPAKNSLLAYTNRGIWHLTGLYSMSTYFDFFTEAGTWKGTYDSRFNTVMDTLVHGDGSYNEITFSYPRSVILWCMHLHALMKDRGDTSKGATTLTQKMTALAKYLVDCSMPNHIPPFWGQGEPGSLDDAIRTLLDSMVAENDNSLTAQNLRYFLDPANGIMPQTHAQYNESKVVSDRTGWTTRDSFFFMNGKSGGNHTHRDALAMLFYYDGRSLLADTGMTSYDRTHPHFVWQNETTRSHNTIEIDGKPQAVQGTIQAGASLGDISMIANDAASTVTAWTKTSGKTIKKGQHSTDFTHYRNVAFLKELGDLLIVTDKVVPGDSASHTYTQNWHTAPYSNATIASDGSGTGKTAYSTGPNLIIAQSGSFGTAALGTGYDASAPGTTTKYFEYKQTKAGTASYQTVLYPTSAGTTATVKPTKLTVSDANDATAMASRIDITDSARPDLRYLYVYSSFETASASHSFAGYTTDGATAVLNLNSAYRATFAHIARGSSLVRNDNGVLLTASATVSDLTAVRRGETLYLYSSDPKADRLFIKVNFTGIKFNTVLLNGEKVPFTTDAQNTVILGGHGVLLHFDNDSPANTTASWTPYRMAFSIDKSKGVLCGNTTGGDPYLVMKSAEKLGYVFQSGDVVEVRVKSAMTSGSEKGFQIFFGTTENPGFAEKRSVLNSSYTPNGTYQILTMDANSRGSMVGQTLTHIRMDPISALSTSTSRNTFEIDYIYIGPKAYAPSCQREGLYFAFDNALASQVRYANPVYGGLNYDIGNWVGNGKRNTTPVFDNGAGTVSYNLIDGATGSYIQPCTASYSSLVGPLLYTPKAGDMAQVRFKLTNFVPVAGTTPYFQFYYLKDNNPNGIQGSDLARIKLSPQEIKSGKYITVTLDLPASFTTASVINTVRVGFSGITNAAGKTASVTIDFVAVGQKSTLPKTPYAVTFKATNGSTLETRYAVNGDEVSYGGTIAPTPNGNSNHLIHSGWANSAGIKVDLSKVTGATTVYPYFTTQAHSSTAAGSTCSVCGYTVAEHTHSWGAPVDNQPVCTQAGTRTYKCSCGAIKTETLAAKSHTVKVLTAVAATCTKTGLTRGEVCTTCGTVIVAQKTVAKTAHRSRILPAVPATCTATGLTQGSQCSVCKTVLTAQSKTAALGHRYSKYTNTNGSIHTIQCTRCTATKTAAHSYSNYKCVCGDMGSPKMLFNFNNLTTDQARYNSTLYGKTNFDTTAAWGVGGGRVSRINIDTAAGTLAMQIASGKDSPYVQTVTAGGNLTSRPLSYYPRSGDVVQLRFKMTNCKAVSGATPQLRIYFIKNGGTTGVQSSDYTKVDLNTNAAFCGDWVIMTVPMSANFADANVINALRVSFNGVQAVEGKTGSITLQYICVGPRANMPNDYRLFMDFTNTKADQNRFKTALYGTYNFDTGYWGYNASRSTKPVYNTANGGTLSFQIAQGGNQPYIQMTDPTGSLSARPMKYNPEAGDTLKIRFKLTNCKAMSGVTPSLRLFYIKNYSTSGVAGTDYTGQNLNVNTAFSGNYVTLTIPLNSTFTTAKYINALRISFMGVEAVAGKTATVTIDYIAIGQSHELP